MPRTQSAAVSFLLVCLCFGAACSDKSTRTRASIKLGYIPYDTAIADRRAAFEALRGYLESKLNVDVTLTQTASYQPAINAMKAGEIDLLNFGAYSYLIAEKEADAEAFAVRGHPDGTPYQYHCLIISPSDRPWGTIEEAIESPGDLNVLFTNEASTSGYLIASSFFRSKGISSKQQFANHSFSNSHILSILFASQGECDLACVSSNYLDDLLKSGKISRSDLNVLWRSDPIPNGPVAYRSDLDPKLKSAIKKAFLDAHKSDRKTWTQIEAQYPDRPFIYIPANPESFTALRKLVANEAN